MRKFFNDLSIRSKLILLIGGTVCVLTAGVLTLVWVQSMQQVRSIVRDQLDANRQLFAVAERSHFQTHVYKATTFAASPDVIHALARRDRAAACAYLSRLLSSPRVAYRDDHDLDYVSIRLPDGSPLAFAVQHHP